MRFFIIPRELLVAFAGAMTLLATSANSAVAGAPDCGRVDRAVTIGKSHMMNENQPCAETIMFEGIEDPPVGAVTERENIIDFDARAINPNNRMMMPEFVDAHRHLLAGLLVRHGADPLSDDKEDLIRSLREFVADPLNDRFLLGFGRRYALWTDGDPAIELLDEPDFEWPIFRSRIDRLAGWASASPPEKRCKGRVLYTVIDGMLDYKTGCRSGQRRDRHLQLAQLNCPLTGRRFA